MPADGTTVFRLHPTINFARVGTSDDYYLSPETSAGLPTPGAGNTVGGLPIKKGTEDEPITSDDLRDDDGHLRRQAARFRIFAYDFTPPDRYPGGAGVELCTGSTLADGRVVKDVVWTVHLANKKANAYSVVPSAGLQAYDGKVPQLRNPSVYGDVDAPARLQQLVIDPGPRAIASSAAASSRSMPRHRPATPTATAASASSSSTRSRSRRTPTPSCSSPRGRWTRSAS